MKFKNFGITILSLIIIMTNKGEGMKIKSSSFEHNGKIPTKYSCDGEDISPHLTWQDVPEKTKSLVLIVDDPDAQKVAGYTWVHWIVKMDPKIKELKEGTSSKEKKLSESIGKEYQNHFEQINYGGSCPPDKEHKYHFVLFALDVDNIPSDLQAPFNANQFEKRMKNNILSKAEIIGRYERKK